MAFLSGQAHAGKAATRVQKINFEETDVDGKVRQPDGSFVTQKKGIEFIPLYKLKENFDEQIEESLEYVK
jgi:hypothetical protein